MNAATVVVVEDRGCDYCRDDQNMGNGHVEQVASSSKRGLLLQCPRCGSLYLDPSDGVSDTRYIDAETASSWFEFRA